MRHLSKATTTGTSRTIKYLLSMLRLLTFYNFDLWPSFYCGQALMGQVGFSPPWSVRKLESKFDTPVRSLSLASKSKFDTCHIKDSTCAFLDLKIKI